MLDVFTVCTRCASGCIHNTGTFMLAMWFVITYPCSNVRICLRTALGQYLCRVVSLYMKYVCSHLVGTYVRLACRFRQLPCLDAGPSTGGSDATGGTDEVGFSPWS